MKAVLIKRFGPATEVAEVVDLPDPGPPGPGQVLLDILAAPINPSDFLACEGRFGAVPTSLPANAGGEAVGQVAAIGPDVTHLRTGDRVLALHAGRGNWRQRVLAPAAAIRPLPAAADPLQLAMLAVNPATALHMLTRFVTLPPGAWVIQNAGNSAVAYCVARLARHRGLHTVSVVRRPEQVEPARHASADVLPEHAGNLVPENSRGPDTMPGYARGADVVLVDGPDLPARVAAALGHAPVRLGLDAVAGEATARLSRCLTPGATLVVYGLLSSPNCVMPAAELIFRNITLRGYWFTPWFDHALPEEIAATYDELGRLVVDGTIKVAIEATYPMEQVRKALTHAARPGRSGKVLLLPNPAMLLR